MRGGGSAWHDFKSSDLGMRHVCALLPVPCSREVEVARCARAPGPAAEALGMAMDSAGPTAEAVDTAAETTVFVEPLVWVTAAETTVLVKSLVAAV